VNILCFIIAIKSCFFHNLKFFSVGSEPGFAWTVLCTACHISAGPDE
jgi:hypothetical protein